MIGRKIRGLSTAIIRNHSTKETVIQSGCSVEKHPIVFKQVEDVMFFKIEEQGNVYVLNLMQYNSLPGFAEATHLLSFNEKKDAEAVLYKLNNAYTQPCQRRIKKIVKMLGFVVFVILSASVIKHQAIPVYALETATQDKASEMSRAAAPVNQGIETSVDPYEAIRALNEKIQMPVGVPNTLPQPQSPGDTVANILNGEK